MYLESSVLKKIYNPTEKQIKDAFSAFDSESSDDFLILSKNEMTYIQTAISEYEEEGFIIEYQEARLDKHYVTTNKNIPKDAVIESFISYLSGTADWQTAFEWVPVLLDDEELE